MLTMMMHQCTSSAPGTTPPPPIPPTVELYSLMAREGGQRNFSVCWCYSSGAAACQCSSFSGCWWQCPEEQVKVLLSATVTKESSFRSTAPSPHQTYDRWPLLLLEMDTYTIIYFTENHWGLNGFSFLRFFQTCEGKCPNFPHQIHYVRNSWLNASLHAISSVICHVNDNPL